MIKHCGTELITGRGQSVHRLFHVCPGGVISQCLQVRLFVSPLNHFIDKGKVFVKETKWGPRVEEQPGGPRGVGL